jgi:hypothetical protein
VDFDGDGILDMISGSYDPGAIYLFRGEGKGKFKARETITDKSGKQILRVPDQKHKVESFGSWVALVDWNNDGALDILLGGYDGSMVVRLNEGTRTKPAYAALNTPVLLADGKPLKVPGGHASPVIADWDGDGLWDIISGSADGGVYWFRNVGKLGAPRFAAPVALIAPHVGNGYSEFLDVDEEPRPGIRSQIAVVDYNGDGKLDILLGDFCTYVVARRNLAPDQRKELLAVRKRMAEIEPALAKEQERIEAKLKEVFQHFTRDDWAKEENQQKWRQKQKELYADPAYKNLARQLSEQRTALEQYLEKPSKPAIGDDLATAHGYVWLYLRK